MDGGFSDKPRTAGRHPSVASAAETEDFLYHLYRGSELLQDNRVLEAKEELENALRLQPRDAKGQDLLAVVYFRLGLYPRAIEIYEELCRAFPRDASLGKNLALCYLKTGQAERTRTLLEQVVRTAADDLRAWSYLGLAYERLGEYEKARAAFERGQQYSMAKRMDGLLGGAGASTSHATAGPPPSLQPARLGRFQELDGDAYTPHASMTGAAAGGPAPADGRPGGAELLAPAELERGVASMRASIDPLPGALAAPPELTDAAVTDAYGSIASQRSSWPVARHVFSGSPAPQASSLGANPPAAELQTPPIAGTGQLVRELLLSFPREPGISLHANGLVLVRIADTFATRLKYVCAISTAEGLKATALAKRIRTRDLGEPLGGAEAPIVALSGADHLMLAPQPGKRLLALALDNDSLYIRESAVVAFESGLTHESGRLSPADAAADAPVIPMVLLRGRGALVLEVATAPVTLEVKAGRFCIARRDSVIGWTGRLLCYEASSGPDTPFAPSGDLVRFVGDGALIVEPSAHPGLVAGAQHD